MSSYGEVEVLERVWRSRERSYERKFCFRIGVTPKGVSRRLKRILADFGSEHSFAQAAARVKEHYGFEISISAVRAATLETAQRADEKLKAHYATTYRILPPVGKKHIVAEADGTMICTVQPGKRKDKRPREWKEMRLTAAQAKGSSEAIYAATFKNVDEVGTRLAHCARDAGWGLNSRIHMVADGAEWIRLQGDTIFGDQHDMLCDFYHVSEYLAEASKTVAPSQSEEWRRTQQQRLKSGNAESVIAELDAFREPPDTPEGQAPVTSAHRYLSNRLDCLDYKSALDADLPIGSGLIESGHRHVLQARLKKAGTSWLPQTAEAMAQLRVLRANHQWNALWN